VIQLLVAVKSGDKKDTALGKKEREKVLIIEKR